MQAWLFLAVAALAGMLMAVQGSMNGALGKIIGVLEGNFLLHVVGLTVVALMLFIFGLGDGSLARMHEAPWYLYLGGLLNVAIIYGVMFAVAKGGAGNATTAIITGQLAFALLIDCLGLFGLPKTPFGWERGLGLALMAAAAKLLLK
jgi:transporter family-2 protein